MKPLNAALLSLLIMVATMLAALRLIREEPAQFIARARVEISALDISTTGLASFNRVDFAYGNRMLPQEMVSRMRSSGALEHGLRRLNLPAHPTAIEEAADALMIHLVPGSTTIEVMARHRDANRAKALVQSAIDTQNELRREERGRLAASLLKTLQEAQNQLEAQRNAATAELAAMQRPTPLAPGYHNAKLAQSLTDLQLRQLQLTTEEKQLRQWLDKTGAEGGSGLQDEGASASALRSSISARRVQLASVETTQGPDAQESRRLRAEIESLQGQLRLALQQRLEELRQQLSTLGQSTAELSGKIAAQQQAMADQLNDSLSPKRSSLQLRLEILGAQLKQIQTRRAEVETYSRLDQPALNITVPVEVGDAPEVRHRGTRQAAALFAALLIGLSLHSILRHQAARRVQPHLHD
jgi:hypothetical protein